MKLPEEFEIRFTGPLWIPFAVSAAYVLLAVHFPLVAIGIAGVIFAILCVGHLWLWWAGYEMTETRTDVWKDDQL